MGSLHLRLTLLLLVAGGLSLLAHAAVVHWPLPDLIDEINRGFGWELEAPEPWSRTALELSMLLVLPFQLALAAWASAPLSKLLRALQGAVLSYRDGDFSVSLRAQGSGELGDLLQAHADLGLTLREQRRQLAQRELLLDTVVQHTPLALLLCSAGDRVVYANIAARQLLSRGRSIVGMGLKEVLAEAPAGLAAALETRQDQLVSVSEHGAEEQLHLSQRELLLQGVPHRLVLLRHMTRELAREEVASWKRVIRVISHELNNSLAPISSLAHSGAELARRGELERLPQVFERIAERATHLHSFLSGYASFAKLPQPRLAAVDWPDFVDALAAQCRFVREGDLPSRPGRFDAAQVEQALINLLRNAHESGSAAGAVSLRIEEQRGSEWRFVVADRGPGMSEAVLAQALLPFYSTKRSGTGLGLALAREIAEAHGGRILLANREGGGLAVTLAIPC